MKKFVFLLLVFVLFGCSAEVEVLDSARDLDALLEKRAEGLFSEAVVYDLRPGEDCYNGHISGFTCVFYDNEDTLEDVLKRIETVYGKRAMVIFICEEGSLSRQAANYLLAKGYRNVNYFKTGYLGYVEQSPNFVPEVGCEC